MPKLFNIFNKNTGKSSSKKQKESVHKNLTKEISYYNTDTQKYVNTRVPIHMNITNGLNPKQLATFSNNEDDIGPENSSIYSNNTSDDSFFDNSNYSDYSDSEYSYSDSDSDSDSENSDSEINTFLDLYDNDNVSQKSSNSSIKSNIFSSRYRNKINHSEPSELLYIPSEN
jgi:hypothetical protein